MKWYAGIGSRQAPESAQIAATWLAVQLEKNGFGLRSGGSTGEDQAFEKGISDPANKQIFLPWKNFEDNPSRFFTITPPAEDIAVRFHPRYNFLKRGAQKLIARNSYILLGPNLDDPVCAVICWTPRGRITGGTGQGMRIARVHSIPIFNLYKIESHIILKGVLALA